MELIKIKTNIECDNSFEFVAVPFFEFAVFADTEEIMCLSHKLYTRYAVFVREQRPMTVAKVQAPDFYVSIRRAGYDQAVIERDVHSQHWLLMAVQV